MAALWFGCVPIFLLPGTFDLYILWGHVSYMFVFELEVQIMQVPWNYFCMNMLVNCAHIWSVDLVQFQDDVAGAILFKVPSFEILVGDGQ